MSVSNFVLNDDSGELEELDELEELVEISEEDIETLTRQYSWSLFQDIVTELNANFLDEPIIKNWINLHKNSPVPVCLLDLDLNIKWANLEFLKQLTFKKSPVNHCLPELFSLDNSSNSNAPLTEALENKNYSYSWTGRLFPMEYSGFHTYLKAIIQPIVFEKGLPLSYSCIWDIITQEFKEVLQNTFISLLEASKLKDNDTGNHIERVNHYSEALSSHLKNHPDFPEINDSFIEEIRFLASMHDVGKIGTPDDILNKKGSLEEWERRIMNEHTKNGAYILSTYPNPMARQIALSHHEKWDGSGYPYGIMGDMVPLAARIVSIADVYDALRSPRSYKAPFPHKVARNIIFEGRDTQFDPKLVDAFIEIENQFDLIFSKTKDS